MLQRRTWGESSAGQRRPRTGTGGKVLCLNVSFVGCGRQDTVLTQLTWLLRLVKGEVDKIL